MHCEDRDIMARTPLPRGLGGIQLTTTPIHFGFRDNVWDLTVAADELDDFQAASL